MKIIGSAVNAMWKQEDGQDVVEYSLLLSVIALGALSFILVGANSVKSIWTYINTHMTGGLGPS